MKNLTFIQKKLFLVYIFSFFSVSSTFAQLKVNTNGKIQTGTYHNLDKGWFNICNDGVTNGLSIYQSSNGGSDLRIYRKSNIAYFTRGGDDALGLRIDNIGRVGLGNNQNWNTPTFHGLLSIYRNDGLLFTTFSVMNFDYGDAQKSVVYRPNSIGLSVWNGNSRTFYVLGSGKIYSTGMEIISDVSTKKNIETIQNSLSKVMQLRGVTFESLLDSKEPVKMADKETLTKSGFSDEYQLTSTTVNQMNNELNRKRIGVIAQEVEQIVPEVVRTTHDGKKAVAYFELVGLLIEAVKEQQQLIEKQNIRITALEGNKQIQLKSSTENESTTDLNEISTQCVLSQNTPNPFTENTEINYYVSSEIKQASICIFDMQGKMLETYSAQTGQNTITIEGAKLQAGMYLYSLIIDGKIADTKRMVLTK